MSSSSLPAVPALPLERADVEVALAPLGAARMLPAAVYTNSETLAWERANVFAAGWVAVAHASALAEPGAQVAASAGTGSVLVVRDGENLRAFTNVCRHRGHELLGIGERACRPSIRCPYHSWAYDLDGRLRHAPGGWLCRPHGTETEPAESIRAAGGAHPDPDVHALGRVGVAEHLGWIFVNATGAAGSIADSYAGLAEILAAYDAGGLTPIDRRSYEVAANWKVIHENYQECLHCPGIHPELSRVSPPDSGENLPPGPAWVGGWMDLADDASTMSMTGNAVGAPLPGLDDRARRRVAYVALLPNLLVSAHPDYVLTHLLEPLTVDRTRVTCEWLAAPGTVLDDAVELWDVTNRQDWAACESVQRGLASGAYIPGPIAPREDAVHGVVQWFARQYLDDQSAMP